MQQVSVLKVESIKILTARPALNWPSYHALCLPHAVIMQSDARCHGRDLALGGRTGECAWVVRALRGVGGVGTHAAQHWVQRRVSAAACGWQSTNIACQSPDWSWLNKYSKISNSCVSFESNRIASNYSIRFEISNIRTSLASTL